MAKPPPRTPHVPASVGRFTAHRCGVLKNAALLNCYGLAGLPFHHHDPFDRMLIAQARHEGWEIVSKDSEFKAYPVRIIW